MPDDGFEASVVVSASRANVWERLTSTPLTSSGPTPRYWLAGFDAAATTTYIDEGRKLEATKDADPCGGTSIVIELTDDSPGPATLMTVAQHGFGEWFSAMKEILAVGWRHIIADIDVYLTTGVHPGRHGLPWGDLGAAVTPTSGGLAISDVRPGGLADAVGLQDADLLVILGGAPVVSPDDLATVLRVLGSRSSGVRATWVRAGSLHHSQDAQRR